MESFNQSNQQKTSSGGDSMLDKAYNQVERDYSFNEKESRPPKGYAPRDYYNTGGIEVINYIRAKLTPEQYKGYLLGNIYKYSGRAQYKGEYEKDITKMSQYVNWLLQC